MGLLIDRQKKRNKKSVPKIFYYKFLSQSNLAIYHRKKGIQKKQNAYERNTVRIPYFLSRVNVNQRKLVARWLRWAHMSTYLPMCELKRNWSSYVTSTEVWFLTYIDFLLVNKNEGVVIFIERAYVFKKRSLNIACQ